MELFLQWCTVQLLVEPPRQATAKDQVTEQVLVPILRLNEDA
jgi:hypothetical protein